MSNVVQVTSMDGQDGSQSLLVQSTAGNWYKISVEIPDS